MSRGKKGLSSEAPEEPQKQEAPLNKGYLKKEDVTLRRLIKADCEELEVFKPLNDTRDPMKMPDGNITGEETETDVLSDSVQENKLAQTDERVVTVVDGTQATDDARFDVENVLVQERGTEPPVSQRPKIEVNNRILDEISELLMNNTLESHKKVLKLMKESGIIASKRWDDIHSDPDTAHEFSKVSRKRVNSFAKWVSHDWLKKLGPDAVIMDIGCGFGNDAKYMARHSKAKILGVDISPTAIAQAQRNIEENKHKAWAQRVTLVQGNFFPNLEAWADEEGGLDGIYSHSTLHYAPPLVLRDVTFPLIARALTGSDENGKEQCGKLYMAMKIADSASARSKYQRILVADDPYFPSFDTRDQILRWYAKDKRRVLDLMEPSFVTRYARVVHVPDYDRKGDTEVFVYYVGTPKETIPVPAITQLPPPDPSVF